MSGTDFPSGIIITRFEIGPNPNKALSESIFTRAKQSVTLSGGTSDRWDGLIETEPLDARRARAMTAFFATVGLYGLFNVGDPTYHGAESGVTSGLVQGAGQSGTSLVVDGLPASTIIGRAGEYCQVRDEYKILKSDATTNVSGVVTLSFWPALRVSPADNDPVIFNTPRITAIITSLPAKADFIHSFAFSFEEALITS